MSNAVSGRTVVHLDGTQTTKTWKGLRVDEPIDPYGDHDPCDEMVTDEQVIKMAAAFISSDAVVQNRSRVGSFYKWANGHDPYDRAAAIWGCTRDEAKRRAYSYCYSGKP